MERLGQQPDGPWGLPVSNFNDLNAPNGNQGFGTANINGFGIGAPGTFDRWTYAFKDVLTKVHGSHTIKMERDYSTSLCGQRAVERTSNLLLRNMWNFLNDAPSQEQATFNPITGGPTDFRKDTHRICTASSSRTT